MAIENAKYMKDIISNKVCAVNCMWDGQYMSIPIGTNNRHYVEIMKQVEAGTLTIEDAD